MQLQVLTDIPGIDMGMLRKDSALVVTTPEVSAIRDADRIIGLLEANEMKNTHLIVNRIRMDMVKRGDMMSMEDVVEILAIDIIGAVPDDENIVVATNQGEPLVGNDTLAGQAYMNICKRITGEEVPFLDLDKKGFFAKGRLQMMLVSDRANCSPEVMEAIKRDIMDVLAKYVEIDTEKLDIQINQGGDGLETGNAPVLLANIPIKSMKGR